MNGGKFDFLRLRRRFRQPLTTGHGTVESVDRILLRTEDAAGIGYGEIAPWPGFLTESCDQAATILHSARGSLSHLRAVAAASPDSLPCLGAALSSCSHWSAIESFAGALPCAGLLTEPSPAALAAKLAQGFRTIKLKVTAQMDLTAMESLLAGADPSLRFRLDANGAFDLESARRWVAFVRAHPAIDFLEQPLPVGHAGYASLGEEKVALDESFLTPRSTTWAGPLVIKPSLVGDWDHWRRWRAQHGGQVVYSSSFETAFGRQAGLWFAAQDPAASPVGFDTLGYFERDGRDRHAAGPLVRGLLDVRWAQLWTEMK